MHTGATPGASQEAGMTMTHPKTKKTPFPEREDPRLVRGKPLLIAGLRRRYNGETMSNIPEQWQRFASHIGKIPGQASGVTYGVCWEAADGDGIEYLSGVEVTGFAGLRSEFTVVSIPAHRYAIFAHREHVSSLSDTVEAIFNRWLPESGHKAAGAAETPDFFERYSEEFNSETGMGGMEVWVPIHS
jgi:AraC family transcriptional regulator